MPHEQFSFHHYSTKGCTGDVMREHMVVDLPKYPVDCRHPMLQLVIWNQVRFRNGAPLNIDPERIRHYGFEVADDAKTPRELFTDVVITHGPHNLIESKEAEEVVEGPEFAHVPQEVTVLIRSGRIQLVDVAPHVPQPGEDLGEGRRAVYDPATADDRLSLGLLLSQLVKLELRIINLNYRESKTDPCYIGPIGTYEEVRAQSGRMLKAPRHSGVLWIPRVPNMWQSNHQKVFGYVIDLGVCDRLECGYYILRSMVNFVPRSTRFVQFKNPTAQAERTDEAAAAEPEAAYSEDADDGTSRPGQQAGLTYRMRLQSST